MLNEIESDLQTFADLGTPVFVDNHGAEWWQDGEEMKVRFFSNPGNEFPDVEFRGERCTYLNFLAGPHMADLQRLADFTARLYAWTGSYIETNAQMESDSSSSDDVHPATDLLRWHSTQDLPFLLTRVIFVRGEAGAGKTVILRRLTSSQAASYRVGTSGPLFFYVNAQGRALSRLEDAMAKELDDIRARFPYRAIGPLTRRGLLIPIIDGFDELLGSGGYDDAFSSLASFLETLNGRGSIIASARSAFFDYRDFYENARRFAGGSLKYATKTLDIVPWSYEKIESYFNSLGGEDLLKAFRELYLNLDETNKRLLEKPFYASKVAELLKDGVYIKSGSALMAQLVDAFLEREVSKFLDREYRPLLSLEGHREFLENLAEEMWWQESRRLDVVTVQTVAELVAENHRLPPSVARALVEKVSSYAFLTSHVSEKRYLSFEHEVFYGFFLAQKLGLLIEQGGANLRRFLARSVLDPSLVEQTVALLEGEVERSSTAVDSICSVMRPMLSDALARENAGLLVAAILRSAGTLREGIALSNLIMRRVDLRSIRLEKPRFEGCDFYEVDFTDAQVVYGVFDKTILRDIKINVASTKFPGVRLSIEEQVLGLVVFSQELEESPIRTYSPELIAWYLKKIGVIVEGEVEVVTEYSPKVLRRIALVERLSKKAMAQFYMSENDSENRAIFQDEQWRKVRQLLEEFGFLEQVVIPRSGPREPLLRLTIPPGALRRGEDLKDPSVAREVRQFWERLVSG